MAGDVLKIIAATENHLQQLHKEITDDCDGKLTENFRLDDFCIVFENEVKKIIKITAKIVATYSTSPKYNGKEIQDQMSSIEAASDHLISLYYSLPKKMGHYFHLDIYEIVRDIMRALVKFIQSIYTKASKKETLEAAENVYTVCSKIQGMPRNNLESVLDLLCVEEWLLADARQDIDKAVISDFSAQKLGEEIDNTEMWNNQDRELILPCITLVKTTRCSLKKIKASIKANGDSKSLINIAELDCVGLEVENLCRTADALVVAIYPPMSQETVKKCARDIVNTIQKVLNQIQHFHFMREEDEEWRVFFLKALDHNNNKLQPLLSED